MLQISSISKNFGEKQVLDNVSLDVQEGKVVVILGPSGCGKSTLLRCINGLEKIDGGTIKFKEEPYSKDSDWQTIRQQIGMVFQSYELFPHMTVMGNLTLAPIKVQKRDKKDVETKALELLERVGLADRADAYPHQLSGGQKQRIAIVRALCMNPTLMLFDEVTASIDPEMVYEVLQVIKDLKGQGMTMMIVTHEMGFARNVADEIIFMDGGHIVEQASPADFFANPQTERAKQFLSKFLYTM
ncbi:MAG: amino acid ABC transporter ATP-binding protein [Defluviitaleaceae bacterium]|nr:amino acid ABC transporter ATP-binding protein [Defluviitaleaceae bacterium]